MIVVKINPNLPYVSTLKTIMHEMTHVKQFVKNEFPNTTDYKVGYTSHDVYLDLPWEQDAREYEVVMATKWAMSKSFFVRSWCHFWI